MSVREVDPSLIRRILIIKMRAIGDVLLSTVVIPNLSKAFPGIPIDFLTEPPSADVVRGNPGIAEVVIFDRNVQSGPGLLKDIRRRTYDLVIDLFGNPRTALVTRVSGARYRVGFRFRGRGYAYTHGVNPRGNVVHNTQFNLDAIESIGVPVTSNSTYFPLPDIDEEFGDNFIVSRGLSGDSIVAFNGSGGWYTKRWRGANFAILADRLAETYGVRPLLVWGPGELQQVEEIANQMKTTALIPPQTSLGQMGALLRRCSLMVTNDSGPMHIAASLGVPVVGIYGPTNPVLQGPHETRSLVVRNESVPCLGCNLVKCPIEHPCMDELSVDMVFNKAKNFLDEILLK